jgi:hypothetical protein
LRIAAEYPAIPGLAILPGFLIILFGCDACKSLILQEPALGEFLNRELLRSTLVSTKTGLPQSSIEVVVVLQLNSTLQWSSDDPDSTQD